MAASAARGMNDELTVILNSVSESLATLDAEHPARPLLLGVAIVRRLNRSSIGLLFRGISQSDILAEHVGINTMKYKVIAFVVGSMCAALGGVLYTYITGNIQPTSFTLEQANYYIVWAAVGGLATFWGPILGSLSLNVLSEFLRPVKEYEPVIYAALLIAAMLLFKGGLMGALRELLAALKGRTKKRGVLDRDNLHGVAGTE